MAEPSQRRDSNSELLHELEALSQSLYQSHTARRTASLILPRNATPDATPAAVGLKSHAADESGRSESRARSRRMSMSPWRSRPTNKQQHQPPPPLDHHDDEEDGHRQRRNSSIMASPEAVVEEKKGIWSWKPMRALSHIGMHRLGCLFSVEIIAIQNLPASMNGLRLSVAVRKKETKDGAVQTMPARILQGAADFEETMFIRCHLYCTGGSGHGKPVKFEPRPFIVSAIAIDAPELDFGKSTVDLSLLVKESMEKNLQGTRLRHWEKSFKLAGKAKGGDLLVKLGFQIMEDGGLGIYAQSDEVKMTPKANKARDSSPFARRQSKSSFSVTSPRTPNRVESATTPTKVAAALNYKEIDDFTLDEPPPPLPPQKTEPEVQEVRMEELDLPEFEVVDKGVETQDEDKKSNEPAAPDNDDDDEVSDAKSASSEVVVKEVVVHDPAHQMRLTELDSIAKQIKELESMIGEGGGDTPKVAAVGNGLDADEETVTREFLHLLEIEDGKEFKFNMPDVGTPRSGAGGESEEGDANAYISDLGKGLGPVVQTKDGGYLTSMNPFDAEVLRKETPKLAMQVSKPVILREQNSTSGFEVFQRLTAMGPEALGSELLSLVAMDELMGKTAEQIAFEGIASAIISGRNKDSASSSAARSIAALKTLAAALGAGRKERIATGIWNVGEDPVAVEDLLASSLQKIEAMAVESLKIQADMAEEEAPFDVFTLVGKDDPKPPLASAVPLEEWAKSGGSSSADNVTVLIVVQLRDPVRRYEKVGAPVVGLIQATRADGTGKDVEEEGYKVTSLHIGGMRLRSTSNGVTKGGGWDEEKQRLTAMQWLVAYGLGKASKKAGKGGAQAGKTGQDLLWSMSSRVMAEMWLKQMRNPDVKFPK